MLVWQAFLNMACATGLFPTTGKPLPFISSGGSSVISSLLIVGVLMSVSYGSNVLSPYEQRRNDLNVLRVERGRGSSADGSARERSRYVDFNLVDASTSELRESSRLRQGSSSRQGSLSVQNDFSRRTYTGEKTSRRSSLRSSLPQDRSGQKREGARSSAYRNTQSSRGTASDLNYGSTRNIKNYKDGRRD